MNQPDSPTVSSKLERQALEAAADVFAQLRYEDASLEQIAEVGDIRLSDLSSVFPTLHDAGAAVLSAEGDSMRQAMAAGREISDDPLHVLQRTFELIGRNMYELTVVRAGMRLAAESRQYFPERRIDPYRTWHTFVIGQLEAARERRLLREEVDLVAVSWLLVSAGMGTKDLVAFRDAWDEIAERLNATLATVLDLIRAPGAA